MEYTIIYASAATYVPYSSFPSLSILTLRLSYSTDGKKDLNGALRSIIPLHSAAIVAIGAVTTRIAHSSE